MIDDKSDPGSWAEAIKNNPNIKVSDVSNAEYQFTQDWFHWAPNVLKQLIPLLPARKKFLEIGSFEGRSTVWIMEHMLEDGGYIDCVDTWAGGEEHSAEDMAAVEARFDFNTELAKERLGIFNGDYARTCFKQKTTSIFALAVLMGEGLHPSDLVGDVPPLYEPKYDFIYIDGSHTAPDVLTDAVMAWQMLKKFGVMVFDDYLWGNPRDALHRPKVAIDAFVNIFAEQVDVIHSGYQFVVRKK